MTQPLPDDFPTKWVPLHLLIDRLPVGGKKAASKPAPARYTVRILPPVPMPDESVPDDLYLLDVEEKVPACVAGLVGEIETALNGAGKLEQNEAIFASVEKCGQWVDRVLFATPEIGSALRSCLSLHDSYRNSMNLGLLIGLHFGKGATDLSTYVWETWRTDVGGGHPFIIMRPWVALARFVPSLMTRHSAIVERSDWPVRILTVTSSFAHDGSDDERLNGFIAEAQTSTKLGFAALSERQAVEMKFLHNPTLETLRQELRTADVFHHFGHGKIDSGGPFVMLQEPGTRMGKKVYWYDLRDCLDPHHARRLKLVILNSCDLQRAGLGTNIAKLGVPAVIAMQATVGARTVAECFIRELYGCLAAGQPVHAAFSHARKAIWLQSNKVEPFVPILLLGTLDSVTIGPSSSAESGPTSASTGSHPPTPVQPGVDPTSAQREEDTLQRLWDEACRLEEQGQLERARTAFTALLTLRADYPGANESVARLQLHARALELAGQIEAVAGQHDHEGLRRALADTQPLGQHPALAPVLNRVLGSLVDELDTLRAGKRWPEARRLLDTLESQDSAALAIASRIPGRIEFEAEVATDLAVRRRELSTLKREARWDELVSRSREYLEVDPDNAEVRLGLTAAEGVVAAANQITLVESYDELREKAHRAKRLGDTTAVAELARQMLRVRSHDANATQLLTDVLQKEAKDFEHAGNWQAASVKFVELAKLSTAAGRKAALEHAKNAEKLGQWEVVLSASEALLAGDPSNDEARKLKDRAEESLRLLRRIKLY